MMQVSEDYLESDRAAEEAARSTAEAEGAIRDRAFKRIAGALLETLPERDRIVLAWMCDVLHQKPGELAFDLIRAAIIRERPNHREAMGGGGASSKNLERLTQRL